MQCILDRLRLMGRRVLSQTWVSHYLRTQSFCSCCYLEIGSLLIKVVALEVHLHCVRCFFLKQCTERENYSVLEGREIPSSCTTIAISLLLTYRTAKILQTCKSKHDIVSHLP